MTTEQITITGILLATMGMFLGGRWRHDMVAAGALLACVLTGLLAPEQAFVGFGHPAVITVACVLILSYGLQHSGAVDALARAVLPAKAGVVLSLSALIGLGAILSGFMNNVGAMALLMPVAMQLSDRLKLAPGQVLMPLAFGTILGGMTTLIGTPPNMIVSGFRAQSGGGGFGMFDFTPVGLVVASGGIAFVVLFGWRLVPVRKSAGIEGFESGAYVTEARVSEGSKAIGMSLREMEEKLQDADAQILGIVKKGIRLIAANPNRKVRVDDILIIETHSDTLADVVSKLGLELEEAVELDYKKDSVEDADSPEPSDAERRATRVERRATLAEQTSQGAAESTVDTGGGKAEVEQPGGDDAEVEPEKTTDASDIGLMELAILPGSPLSGRSATDILLRSRYGMNLLAISRQGQQTVKRLRSVAFRSGDLLLLQGPPEVISQFAADNGCVPLAQRELRIPNKRQAWTASLIMAVAVGVAAFGLLPAAISFACGVLASLVFRTVSPRKVYQTIDWPVVVLLAALIPVAGAMETTGTAELVGRLMLENLAGGNAIAALTLILVVTMFLSDVMNNAATAAVMCPIALGTASALGVNPDSFLMAVAIGASCAFLTPIGHQNNTLILGPGGFRFGDYWKLGLPLEVLVVAIAIPLLLWVWPL